MIIPRADFSRAGSAGEACNPHSVELHDSAEFHLGGRWRHHAGASSAWDARSENFIHPSVNQWCMV